METKASLIEPLLERAKEYGETSIQLFKLKSLEKTADILSQIVSKLLVLFIVFIFLMTLNIALGLWLGELLGKSYFGFLLLTFVYGITALFVYYRHPSIKAKVNDRIVTILIN
jgi:hypothetical protein